MNAMLIAVLLASYPADYREGWQDGYEWKKIVPPAKEIHWQVVPVQHLNVICKSRAGFQAHACAQWGRELCVIWAQAPEADTPQWLVWHEKKHCAGYVHDAR